MTVVVDILESVALLGVPRAARNMLMWPQPAVPAPMPRLVEGELTYSSAADRDVGRTRVSYIFGPGATLAGASVNLAELLRTMTTRTTMAPEPSVAAVGRALRAYTATYLGAAADRLLLVGLRLPLPVEVDAVSGNWISNFETVAAWAMQPPANNIDWHQPVRPLPIPDPDLLRVAAAPPAAPIDRAAVADGMRQRLLLNPFEPVFHLYELLSQLDARQSDEAFGVAVALASSLSGDQMDLLASTTAGNAALRRLWFALAAVDSAALPAEQRDRLLGARRLLAAALGLAPTAPPQQDVWQHPYVAGVSVTPRELPLCPGAPRLYRSLATAGSTEAAEAKQIPVEIKVKGKPKTTYVDGEHVMVLGRQINAGRVSRYKAFTGPYHSGRVAPDSFAASHRAMYDPDSDPIIEQRTKVVVAIAVNEGLLDAARLMDKGMLSTGLQQWTEHFNNEATVLWEHFRGLDPHHYDLHFALHRLVPRIWVAADKKSTKDPTAAAVTAANPWADAAVAADPLARPTDPHTHFPTYVTLYRLEAGGRSRMWQSIDSSNPTAEQFGPRLPFFGGTGKKGSWCFAPEWGARARFVSLVSNSYRAAQMEYANKRFDRIVRDTGTTDGTGRFAIPGAPVVGGKPTKYDVSDLFTSQYGAALVLDQHINAPGNVPADIDAAIKATAGKAFDGDGKLRDSWLQDFASEYQKARRLADKTYRDGNINKVKAAVLSRTPGSFTGWK